MMLVRRDLDRPRWLSPAHPGKGLARREGAHDMNDIIMNDAGSRGKTMPKRTNEFQQLVAYIYSKISPIGATVTESAELPDGSGAKREIDVLIEHKIADIEIKIAVECRDRSRYETLEWIDSLLIKWSLFPLLDFQMTRSGRR
jgi:hypothetical protein